MRTQTRGVVVEENVVLDGHLQFVFGGAGDGDARNLAELAFLLVHHRADDRAGRGAGHAADDCATLSAVAFTVVADDAAGDRARDAADDGALLRFRVVVDLGKGRRARTAER